MVPFAPGEVTGEGGTRNRGVGFASSPFASEALVRSAACAKPLPLTVRPSTQSPRRERIATLSPLRKFVTTGWLSTAHLWTASSDAPTYWTAIGARVSVFSAGALAQPIREKCKMQNAKCKMTRAPEFSFCISALCISSKNVPSRKDDVRHRHGPHRPHAQQCDAEHHRHLFVRRRHAGVVIGQWKRADEEIFAGGPIRTDPGENRSADERGEHGSDRRRARLEENRKHQRNRGDTKQSEPLQAVRNQRVFPQRELADRVETEGAARHLKSGERRCGPSGARQNRSGDGVRQQRAAQKRECREDPQRDQL